VKREQLKLLTSAYVDHVGDSSGGWSQWNAKPKKQTANGRFYHKCTLILPIS